MSLYWLQLQQMNLNSKATRSSLVISLYNKIGKIPLIFDNFVQVLCQLSVTLSLSYHYPLTIRSLPYHFPHENPTTLAPTTQPPSSSWRNPKSYPMKFFIECNLMFTSHEPSSYLPRLDLLFPTLVCLLKENLSTWLEISKWQDMIWIVKNTMITPRVRKWASSQEQKNWQGTKP